MQHVFDMILIIKKAVLKIQHGLFISILLQLHYSCLADEFCQHNFRFACGLLHHLIDNAAERLGEQL